MFESIVEAVADHAEEYPNKLCVVDAAGEHTYSSLWTDVQRAAQRLKSKNIKAKDCVMVECSQDFRFLVLGLACELLEAIFVPTEKKAPVEKICDVLNDTSAKLFICETQYDIPAEMEKLNVFFTNLQKKEEFFQFPKGMVTAEILYTTGTTGKSKGIEITNHANIALAENVKYGTEMGPDNVELLPLPLSHSHGLRCCYANLLNGSSLIITEGVTNVRNIFELMRRYNVTALDLSPSAVMILMKLSKGKFAAFDNQIAYIQVGTAVLDENTKKLLIQSFPTTRLYNFYGSTESGRSCILDFNKSQNKKGCVGKPTVNARFIVVNEDKKPINSSKDNMGFLASAGTMNMRGYWKQPELTEKVMLQGFVYTNDLGYIDEEGFVYVLGRMDDIINYKGIKIAPEEIESVVRLYGDNILDCACVPEEDVISGQIPVVYVEVRNRELFDKKDLFLFIKKHMIESKMPRDIRIIDKIPRTYNGKLQRLKLTDQQKTDTI